jgi:cysteine-S-conjugate beta-lyase
MTFDFDAPIERSGTFSTKYDRYKDVDTLPMWVADMDFRSPPPVIDALVARAKHGVFGYTDIPDELTEAIVARLKRRYGWHIESADLVFLPGVVPGLSIACRAFTEPGEAVITTTPIYPPFMDAPKLTGRELRCVKALYEQGDWRLPVNALVDAIDGGGRLLLLCSPYNPVGKTLRRDELEAIVEACAKNGVVICADEIHCDLLFDGRQHMPTASIGGGAEAITVTLMSAGKTFNLAGIGGAFAVIRNPALREKFVQQQRGIAENVNLMAIVSMLSAYRDGGPWHEAMMAYLQANRDYLYRELNRLPGIRVNRVEATHLAWVDVSALHLADPPAFFEQAGIGMSEGHRFGDDRFMRLNFGCRRKLLEEAVSRFERAVCHPTR